MTTRSKARSEFPSAQAGRSRTSARHFQSVAKKVFFRGLACLLGLLLFAGAPAWGQTPQQYASWQVDPGSAADASGARQVYVQLTEAAEDGPAELNTIITLHLESASLEEALRRIAEEAGLKLVYGSEKVMVEKEVSLSTAQITARAALKEVLRSTGLRLMKLSGGQLVLVGHGEMKPQSVRLEPLQFREATELVLPTRLEPVHAQMRIDTTTGTGTITGTVTDASSGEPLPGAAVQVEGTSIGTSTNVQGEYRLPLVPAGERTLVYSFLGYEAEEVTVTIAAGETTTQDVALLFETIEGAEVTVTAQLEGQTRAINQQTSSDQIVNVVSSDRIRELPDANAAEAIARLPGISLQRNAGEGQKVVVRGLSPRYSRVTVNGVAIPATDEDNRSVDLSMISPDVLSGIEVFKAPTPDQDAESIGGTVNFSVRRAPNDFQGRLDLRTGYSGHTNEPGEYRGSVSLSNRFFNDRLGVLATGSLQRADRSSDELDAVYSTFGQDAETGGTVVEVEDMYLVDRAETRDRYSGSLALDYELGATSSLFYSGFYGRTDRDETTRRKRYAPAVGRTSYDITARDLKKFLVTNALSGQHAFDQVNVDWTLAQASTVNKVPLQVGGSFVELDAFEGDVIEDRGPSFIPEGARNNVNETTFSGVGASGYRNIERDLTARLDVEVPFALGTSASGYVKVGGKYRDKLRRNRDDSWGAQGLGDRLLLENEGLETFRGTPTITNFLDEGFDAGDFLDNQYELTTAISSDYAENIYNTYIDLFRPIADANIDEFDANESTGAGYVMAKLNIGRRIMILPGLRYERTTNDYEARFFVSSVRQSFGSSGRITDTTSTQTYDEFFPMVHLRLGLTEALDLRLALTKTLARPDYFNLSPYTEYNISGRSVRRSNPNLKHTTAWNYDASLSFYDGRLGLLSASGFYKRLSNVDYILNTIYVTPDNPTALERRLNGFGLREPINAEKTSTVYGFEVELQTNLRFLPSPLDGVVLNANYTRSFSETAFPIVELVQGEPPFYTPDVTVIERTGPIPGQSDHIANFSLGYEKGGFSGRVSLVYQSQYLGEVNIQEELNAYTDDYLRWDAVLTQHVWRGATVYFNANNLSSRAEQAFIGRQDFVNQLEDYGWSGSLGVRYNL